MFSHSNTARFFSVVMAALLFSLSLAGGAAKLMLAGVGAGEAADVVSNYRLRGNTVTAMFLANDTLNPCVENFVLVLTSDQVEKVSPGPRTISIGTILTVIQQDTCAGTELFRGFAETNSQSFKVTGDVTTATVSA